MKSHYFRQADADADDTTLQSYKNMGFVPKTCLLGGLYVELSYREGKVPCGRCPGPRRKCFGAPQAHSAANVLEQMKAPTLFASTTADIQLNAIELAKQITKLITDEFELAE